MITSEYVRTMAGYNHWQNTSIYSAADQLSDAQRKQSRAAFWDSVHGTLNHLLWGDQIWMSRFAGTPTPKVKSMKESSAQFASWPDLKAARAICDQSIIDWASKLAPDWLQGDLTWFSGAAGRELTKPKWLLVTHMFNHQTHHRGQVHCMLTQCGVKPDDTDLPFKRT
jgi:uncharacterized damage-inducible protein DinB